MTILVVLAHPKPGSFNHAIARAATEQLEHDGHRVVFHDLYAEGFEPNLPHEELGRDAVLGRALDVHCCDVAEADGIIIIHPNWWGQPPAILKGWVDRAIRPGVAYRFDEGDSGEGVPVGLLRARRAIVFNTSNTPPEREQAVFGDPLDLIWKRCIFDLCGVHDVRRRMFAVVVTSTPAVRAAWLDEVRQTVTACFPKVDA